MAERMQVAELDASDFIIGAGDIKRLAKHNNGDIGIVEKDESGTLTIRKVTIDGPEINTQIWTPGNVAEAYATPDKQPGAPAGTFVKLTAAQLRDIKSKGLSFKAGGAFRWKWNTGTS